MRSWREMFTRTPSTAAIEEPEAPETVTVLKTDYDGLLGTITDLQSTIRTLRHLQTLAGSRAINLAKRVAAIMDLQDYTVGSPELDAHTRTWSIIDITGRDGKVLSIYVPIFEPNQWFAIVDRTGETPSKRWFQTKHDGKLTENTILMIRGLAGFFLSALADPTRSISGVAQELDEALAAILRQGSAEDTTQVLDQLIASND